MHTIPTDASLAWPAHMAASVPPGTSGGEEAGPGRLPGSGAGRLRVLVVDDAPDVVEMLGVMMRVAGFDVETALSAAEALELARGGRFDVIISDIGMPFMNGYELAERLRQTPGYEAVPLIALTGFTMYDDRDRALTAGFDDFLTKPIRGGDLLGAVERHRK